MSDRRDVDDRRTRKDRRSLRGNRGANDRVAVVEISRRHLRIVVLHRLGEDTPDRAFFGTQLWNEKMLSLHTPEGLEELVKGLKKLATEYGLLGQTLKVVLSGEFCVTRAVRGASEVVRFELQRLEQRSRLYLSLGPGEKVVVSSTKALDARHDYLLAAACNAKTLDTIHLAAQRAGMLVESIEPALVAVSSAVHRLKEEPDEPYLVLHLDGSAAEIGVCHQRQLLLDYRPGGRANAQDLYDLIQQHLGRLQRHVGHHLGIATPTIRRVFLCGERVDVEATYAEFSSDSSFQTTIIEPEAIQATWSFSERLDDSELIPALGSVLSTYLDPADRVVPNFMDHILAITREPLRPTLVRSAIPLAATLLIGVCVFLFNMHQQRKLHALQDQMDALSPVQTKARELHFQLVSSERKYAQLEKIAQKLQAMPANDVLNRIGHCLPNDVWLQSLEVDAMQSVQISAASFLEAGAYDFVGWLEKAPGVDDVALLGTQAGNSHAGPMVNFDLELNLVQHANEIGELDN